MYKRIFKPGFDFLIALSLMVAFSPFLVALILILSVTYKGTPIFLQPRPGKNGKIFNIIKFKTMRDLVPGSSIDVHSPERITKVGNYVRKYSIDELLQLINVLKGDMSLVGPRPLLVEYLPLYDQEQQKRHNVKPGITGWAQVNGRNTINWEEKFKLDQWYVDHLSLRVDIKVIYLTILNVLTKKNINQGNETIMPVWTGN